MKKVKAFLKKFVHPTIKKLYILSHLEIGKELTKEIVNLCFIQTR